MKTPRTERVGTMTVTGGKACRSCGSPMASKKDFGGGRTDNAYCAVCTDARGELLPFDDVVRRMAETRFEKVNGMPKAAAAEAARKALLRNPQWK